MKNLIKRIFWLKNEVEQAPEREDSKLLQRFTELNRQCWKEKEKNEKPVQYAYVVNWTPSKVARLVQVMPQLLYLQGKKETENLKIKILSKEKDDWRKEFYESFGASVEVIQYTRFDKIRACMKAFWMMVRRTSGEELIQSSFKKIPVGGYIYDTLIRSDYEIVTIDRVGKKQYNHLVYVYEYLYGIYRLFKKFPPKYYIPYEYVHFQQAMMSMAAHFGADVVIFQHWGVYLNCGSGSSARVCYHDFYRDKILDAWNQPLADNYREVVQRYLEKRFKGTGHGITEIAVKNAFEGKNIISKKDFVEMNNLDPSKKNIIIMPHCFSDGTTGSSSFTLYRDYYVWFEETLKIISTINNVNWIIKQHPSRHMYGETEEAEFLFEKYKTQNMVLFQDEYSTASIIDIADAIVTVQGTVGEEFSCFGIPVIVTGRACYSGFGFTYEPNTVEEYKKILNNIADLPRLNEEQISVAMKFLYLDIMLNQKNFDEFDEFLGSTYYLPILEGNNKVLDYLIERIELNCYYFKDTMYYQLGLK